MAFFKATLVALALAGSVLPQCSAFVGSSPFLAQPRDLKLRAASRSVGPTMELAVVTGARYALLTQHPLQS